MTTQISQYVAQVQVSQEIRKLDPAKRLRDSDVLALDTADLFAELSELEEITTTPSLLTAAQTLQPTIQEAQTDEDDDKQEVLNGLLSEATPQELEDLRNKGVLQRDASGDYAFAPEFFDTMQGMDALKAIVSRSPALDIKMMELLIQDKLLKAMDAMVDGRTLASTILTEEAQGMMAQLSQKLSQMAAAANGRSFALAWST